jgi:hypothetical protein
MEQDTVAYVIIGLIVLCIVGLVWQVYREFKEESDLDKALERARQMYEDRDEK